jgi:hypothetical protein
MSEFEGTQTFRPQHGLNGEKADGDPDLQSWLWCSSGSPAKKLLTKVTLPCAALSKQWVKYFFKNPTVP